MCRGFKAFLIAIMILLIFWIILVIDATAAEIHGNLEIGKDLEKPEAYADVMISLDFDIWAFKNSIYGGWLTWFELPDGGIYMNGVIYDLYTIGYKITYKQFYIKLEHGCRHPEELNYSDKAKSTIAVGIIW